MYSLRYGAIPVAHASGGIQEIVQDYDPTLEPSESGYGFLYYDYSSEAFWDSIKRARCPFSRSRRLDRSHSPRDGARIFLVERPQALRRSVPQPRRRIRPGRIRNRLPEVARVYGGQSLPPSGDSSKRLPLKPPLLEAHDANKARTAASKNRTVTAVLYNIGETTVGRALHSSDPSVFLCPSTGARYDRIPAAAKALSAGLVVTFSRWSWRSSFSLPKAPSNTAITHSFNTIVTGSPTSSTRGYQTIVPPDLPQIDGSLQYRLFPRLSRSCLDIAPRPRPRRRKRLTNYRSVRRPGFLDLFLSFLRTMEPAFHWQFLGALAILAHPAAFFLVAGYSESLFLMALIGFLYWSARGIATRTVLAAIHGIVMSATRIVGLPCALAPLVKRIWELGAASLRNVRDWLPNYGDGPSCLAARPCSAALGFFVYCQFRWGHWDIYMLTQQFGWGIEPDYLAIFKPSSYHWLLPALEYPTRDEPDGDDLRRADVARDVCRRIFSAQCNVQPIVLCASYSISQPSFSISSPSRGVACVKMESMLRYEFCLHPLIVLALLHYLHNLPLRSWLGRASAVTAIALVSAAGLGLESWYIWNFTRGNWVA